MSKIETGRWSEQLRRMLGQKGQEIVASELSAEISATIELEGRAAEWDFLKAVRGCATGANLVGVVANTGNFRLRNPVGSGILATIRQWELTPAGPSNLAAARGTETTDLALSTVATTVLDQRWQGGQLEAATSLIFSVTNLDALGPLGRVFARTGRLGDEPWFYDEELVLPPGTNFDWGAAIGSTNLRLQTWITWHERGLPRLEV